jgi:hypothetical protein
MGKGISEGDFHCLSGEFTTSMQLGCMKNGLRIQAVGGDF